MWILDIIFITWGLIAGGFSYVSGKDYLYKLFLWLIIGFLFYALLESQIAVGKMLPEKSLNPYQIYLTTHTTLVLTIGILSVPFLGIFFMMYDRLHLDTYEKSPSHILLWCTLPFFILSLFAYLGKVSFLRESESWKAVFSFLENSEIYNFFQEYPWVIFILLFLLISYKTLLVLLFSFWKWAWEEGFPQLFGSWKKSHPRKRTKEKESSSHESHEDQEEHESHEDHHGHH